MAGYVAHMVQKKITSCACHEAVGSRQHKSESAFLTLRDRGADRVSSQYALKQKGAFSKC